MNKAPGLTRKIETLKKLEQYGYSVAHFILSDGMLAAEATKFALLEISKEADFFCASFVAQQARLKKTVMREALKVKMGAMTG